MTWQTISTGGSNGGLLTGAMVVQRPELFRAAIVAVPLLDMLRYQNFLMARYWVPEYGSAEDARQFEFLRAYSPYQQVKPGVAYPAVFLTAGENDKRVHALHARNNIRLDGARDFDTHARQLISLIDRFGRGTVATGGPALPKEEIPPFPISLAPANPSRWFLLPLCWAALGLLATLLSDALLRLLAPHGAPLDPRNVLHAMALTVPLGAALWGCGAVVARSSLASHDPWSAALIFQLAAFAAGLLTLRLGPIFGWSPALAGASVALVVTVSQFFAWHPVLNAQRGITYLVAFPCIVYALHRAGESVIPHGTFTGQLLWTVIEFACMGALMVWATNKAAQRSATIGA